MKGPIYLNEKTGVVVIGATGREASQVIRESEALYPGIIKAGVTPGKGGSTELPVPIFDTLAQAIQDPKVGKSINTALIYVPPVSVLDAVMECLDGGIKVLYVITEHVPIRDSEIIFQEKVRRNAVIVGGTSLGCFVPSVGRIGAIGGKDPSIAFKAGGLVIISKSGGLTVTTAEMFKRRGWGTYCALAIGGDIISNTTYADVLKELKDDPNVKGVVMLGEPGGSYEEQAAELIQAGGFNKPVAAFISGRFQERMPEGVAFGHAGAIVERGMGKASDKIARLEAAGKKHPVKVAFYYHELLSAIESLGVPRDFEDSTTDLVKPLYSTIG
uniref:Succinyl-CoA synthetase subunit alpha n=1 Tax=Leptospirillum ferriphilum TaxID=178606 RepID=A0A7C3LUB6_9BACT